MNESKLIGIIGFFKVFVIEIVLLGVRVLMV